MTHDILENQQISQQKIDRGEYDVFVSYNHQDHERVIEICEQLKANNIAPFLDEWGVQPGLPWQPEIEQQIKNCRAAAVFIGALGIGGWQRMEIDALLRAFVRKKRPVIPALLENVSGDPELPDFLEGTFLEGHKWVDFRKNDPDPLYLLIWGITSKRPEKVYRPGVLIASLGDSPVVVSAMYDLLKEREKLTIDRMTILCPHDEEVEIGYNLLTKALPREPELEITRASLDFEDANSWVNACTFLQKLYTLLASYQKQGDSVYLSLAGGRKSMAALMAWVAPFFSCVKGLYHVIDKKEESFLAARDIEEKARSIQFQKMHPDREQLVLVELPFERGVRIDTDLNSFIHRSSPTDYEQREALITGNAIVQQGKLFPLQMTDLALAQFRALCKKDLKAAQALHADLLQMHQAAALESYESDAYAYPPKVPRKQQVVLHSFAGSQASIRTIFYTQPMDMYRGPDALVDKIVVCSLEFARDDGTFRTLKEIADAPDFSKEPARSLPPVPSPAESILVAPLGKSPMVVTQLFTLLREQEQHNIREVVLIYPGLATEIDNSAKLLKQALAREAQDVTCTLVPLPGLEDIASKQDCEKYQEQLELEIARVQRDHPGKKIDLALSGGRKGMTAMTMFAAQKNHIPYVYHTLVDETISETIDQETSYEELMKTSLSSGERQARLFLRAYQAEGPDLYAHFTLFRVPVFSADQFIESDMKSI